jgi:hypothetical protein
LNLKHRLWSGITENNVNYLTWNLYLVMLSKNMFSGVEKTITEAGQVLIIVILAVVVLLTVGMSLASRTIVNLRTTTEDVESQKALEAAQAGVERVIQNNTAATSGTINGAKYDVTSSAIGGTSFLLNGGNSILKNEGVDVWFKSHDSSGKPVMTDNYVLSNSSYIYWNMSPVSACPGPAAIEVIIVTSTSSGGGGQLKTYRRAYDPCNRSNGFTTGVSGTYNFSGETFNARTIAGSLTNGISGEYYIFMRIIPIYQDTVIGFYNGANTLPPQGAEIDATGESGNNSDPNASKTVRKIKAFKGWPQTFLPYLSYGLFVAQD